MSEISVFRRLRQARLEFKDSLGHMILERKWGPKREERCMRFGKIQFICLIKIKCLNLGENGAHNNIQKDRSDSRTGGRWGAWIMQMESELVRWENLLEAYSLEESQ